MPIFQLAALLAVWASLLRPCAAIFRQRGTQFRKGLESHAQTAPETVIAQMKLEPKGPAGLVLEARKADKSPSVRPKAAARTSFFPYAGLVPRIIPESRAGQ